MLACCQLDTWQKMAIIFNSSKTLCLRQNSFEKAVCKNAATLSRSQFVNLQLGSIWYFFQKRFLFRCIFLQNRGWFIEDTSFCKIDTTTTLSKTLRWRHNDHAGVSNHQPRGCLLNRLFRRRSKKTSKLRVTGLCAGNSPGTGEFPAKMASYAKNISIWWRHHGHNMIATCCVFVW